jgi:hypothetical protein
VAAGWLIARWLLFSGWLVGWLAAAELGLQCSSKIMYQNSTSGAYILMYVHTNKFSEK